MLRSSGLIFEITSFLALEELSSQQSSLVNPSINICFFSMPCFAPDIVFPFAFWNCACSSLCVDQINFWHSELHIGALTPFFLHTGQTLFVCVPHFKHFMRQRALSRLAKIRASNYGIKSYSDRSSSTKVKASPPSLLLAGRTLRTRAFLLSHVRTFDLTASALFPSPWSMNITPRLFSSTSFSMKRCTCGLSSSIPRPLA